MAKKRNLGDQKEIRLQLTSMIDVTFLLLIFFMLTMKFKTLERKLAAFLPKDKGLAQTKVKIEPVPTIKVELQRKVSDTATRVTLNGQDLGADEAGFEALTRHIQGIANDLRATGAKEMPGEIFAWEEVPHRHVMKAIDAFMAAKIRDITFVGTEEPGAPQSGRGDPNAQ